MRRVGVVVGRRAAGDTRPFLTRMAYTIGAVVSMLSLWPLAVVCAVAVRLESGAPVFVHEGGLRFRTCSRDGELTRLGRFLRKAELDILPQLFSAS